MVKGKPWTAEEEAKLKQLIDSGAGLETIAAQLGKTENAVYQKCKKLGLKEEGARGYTSSSFTQLPIQLPEELPSVEEALKILAGALKTAAQPGLDKVEVQRLQVIATLARTYKELLADYVGYRLIEAKLLEMEKKYERLVGKAKPKGNASKPADA